jgi:predicted RNA-binding Zn-ribbon protein involved in translation (DUF1610 family)
MLRRAFLFVFYTVLHRAFLFVSFLLSLPPVKCPTCGTSISMDTATPHVPFLCPDCGHGVQLRNSYFRVLHILLLLMVGLLSYAGGARGDTLIWAVILGALPTYFVVALLTMRVFPPDAEPTGEFRGILYGTSTSANLRRVENGTMKRDGRAVPPRTPPSS